jgi:hypothetical protein
MIVESRLVLAGARSDAATQLGWKRIHGKSQLDTAHARRHCPRRGDRDLAPAACTSTARGGLKCPTVARSYTHPTGHAISETFRRGASTRRRRGCSGAGCAHRAASAGTARPRLGFGHGEPNRSVHPRPSRCRPRQLRGHRLPLQELRHQFLLVLFRRGANRPEVHPASYRAASLPHRHRFFSRRQKWFEPIRLVRLRRLRSFANSGGLDPICWTAALRGMREESAVSATLPPSPRQALRFV